MLDFYFYQYYTTWFLSCLNNIIYFAALQSYDGFWFDLVFNVCYYFLFHRSIFFFFTGSKDIKEWRLWPEKNKHCLPVCLSFFLVFRFWKKGLRESPRSSSRSARDAFRLSCQVKHSSHPLSIVSHCTNKILNFLVLVLAVSSSFFFFVHPFSFEPTKKIA